MQAIAHKNGTQTTKLSTERMPISCHVYMQYFVSHVSCRFKYD